MFTVCKYFEIHLQCLLSVKHFLLFKLEGAPIFLKGAIMVMMVMMIIILLLMMEVMKADYNEYDGCCCC